MRYSDFIDLSYQPGRDDLIALFRVEPAPGFSVYEAAGRVASESSVGTWTELEVGPRVRGLMAKAYRFSGRYVWIAYPRELFEEGSLTQIFSSVAGNVFGMKAVRRLRLEDVYWPPSIVRGFPGPLHGISGVRRILGVWGRPVTATVPKPKVGLSAEEFAAVAYELWTGGIDLVKDDENLTSLRFNRFEERVERVMKMLDRAEAETGERKGYLANISAPLGEMVRRARLVKELGGRFVMIDILTVGWSALQEFVKINREELHLAIHAHRAFHAAFTRGRHGVSMKVVAEAARLAGVDHLHVGTVVGKLVSTRVEVTTLRDILTQPRLEGSFRRRLLDKDWLGLKPVFPVSSGGLHPGIVGDVIGILGGDIIVQVGGGVMGHPMGPRAGATAVRQALEAVMEGVPLDEYAEGRRELRAALEKWGHRRPT